MSMSTEQRVRRWRVWVIADRDERTLEVTDVVSKLAVAAHRFDPYAFSGLLDRTIEALAFAMIDHIVASGWRLLAEPLGLQAGAM